MEGEIDTLKQQLPDRYKVEKTLGQGGMGIVFKARDSVLDKPVAIKILKTTVAGSQVVRFHSEAKTLAKLSHPNLLTALDFQVTEQGTPYLVLPFLEGVNLENLIKRQGALPLNQALSLFKQIADGLNFAHSHNVIHRDIKPSNIMLVSGDDKNIHPKIVDFGLSKMMQEDQKVTTTGAIIGSPLYMSPEQARGEEVEKTSDIYSLGCLFFYVLTGTVPIAGENYMSTISKKLSEKAPLLNQMNSEEKFPESLEKLIDQMLAISPQKRIKTLDEVLEELESVALDLSKENIDLEPIKYSDAASKNFGINKKTYILSGTTTLALIAAGVSLFMSMVQESKDATKKYTVEQNLIITDSFGLQENPNHKYFNKKTKRGKMRIRSEGNITDDDLKECKDFENLDQVDLSDSKVTGSGLRYLKGLKITTLNLNNTPVNNEGLKNLKDLKYLWRLGLQRCRKFDSEGTKYLADLDSVSILKLQGTPVDDKMINHVFAMKNLTHLDIRMCENLSAENLELLSRKPNLEILYVGGNEFTNEHMKAISNFKNLTVLYLDGISAEVLKDGLPRLAKLKHVEYIGFERIDKFPYNFSESLSKVKPLKQLYITKCIGVDKNLTANLDKVKQIATLKILSIDFTEKMDCVYGLSDLGFLKELVIDSSAKPAMEAIRNKFKNTEIVYEQG